MQPQHPPTSPTAQVAQHFAAALDRLEAAPAFAKPNHRNHVFELALRLLRMPEGPAYLYQHAARFDRAGVFAGSDWAVPATLQPQFVSSALDAHGWTMAIEVLSELRFLAIVHGQASHPQVTPDQARAFLEEALGLNSFRLFPDSSEASRLRGPELAYALQQFLLFMAENLGSSGILDRIITEADRVLAQRPILTQRVRSLIHAAHCIASAHQVELSDRGRQLIRAMEGPSGLSGLHRDPDSYLAALQQSPREVVEQEAQILGDAMWATGLVCPQHAQLLRHVALQYPELITTALALNDIGTASLRIYQSLVVDLIAIAIVPNTAQSVYGLACLLTCGIMFFPPVPPGLLRLMHVDIEPGVAAQLQQSTGAADADPRSILLAGTLSILGQPLGISQGNNPTCQSARAISLWAQNDTGFLLGLIAGAARDGQVTMHFEGQALHSGQVEPGLLSQLQGTVDPVSTVLVPHLDRIYAEMGRLVADRGEDGHKWINPELHGWWSHRGFATAIDYATGAIKDLPGFLRLFYACYHPQYRQGLPLVYPQPAGVAVTNLWGVFLGWHAVTIQRVAPDPDGETRVYFFNPNSDRGQRWGPELVTSTQGHGEYAGESSLPFAQFSSRVYVFHYDEREHGDPLQVPDVEILPIVEMVRLSWGALRGWI